MTELSDKIEHIASTIPEDRGSPAARKVLACKLLTMSEGLNVKEWCKIAGISRTMWYFVHSQPGFARACADTATQFLGPQVVEVTQAMIRKAKHGGQDGMGDTTVQLAIVRQCSVIDREKHGDNITNVTIIERDTKLKTGMDRLGFARRVEVETDEVDEVEQ